MVINRAIAFRHLKPLIIFMAQSLLITCSDLQFLPIQSSLIRTSLPRRHAAFPFQPRRRPTPSLAAATKSKIIQPMPPSQNNTKSISSDGNSTAPISTKSNVSAWVKYVLSGFVNLMAIPVGRKALMLRDVARRADSVVEVLQRVAEVAEKAAEEVVEVLPNEELKEAALKLMEHIASLVNKNAAVADAFIDKIDDVVAELDTKLQPNAEADEFKTNDVGEKMSVENNLLEISSTTKLKGETASKNKGGPL